MNSELSDSSDSDSSSNIPWIQYFCSLPENRYFCEVDKEYIKDSFNIFGLKQFIDRDYTKALDMIIDKGEVDDAESGGISRIASQLYGLIHARYIVSGNGLDAMKQKYSHKDFGCCPRYHCKGQATLPIGLYDEPHREYVKMYCPKCQDIYSGDTFAKHVDGAAFGSTFPHLFFMTYDKELVPTLPSEKYVPRVFGFRIHSSSSSLPAVAKGGGSTSIDGVRSESMQSLRSNSSLRRRNSYDDGSDDSWNNVNKTSNTTNNYNSSYNKNNDDMDVSLSNSSKTESNSINSSLNRDVNTSGLGLIDPSADTHPSLSPSTNTSSSSIFMGLTEDHVNTDMQSSLSMNIKADADLEAKLETSKKRRSDHV